MSALLFLATLLGGVIVGAAAMFVFDYAWVQRAVRSAAKR